MKYKILQLINPTDYMFMPFEYAITHGFKFSDYYVVYEGEIECEKSIIDVLERLFVKFNVNRPDDFKGHSLSVSDLIDLDGFCSYCNPTGWKTGI